MGKARRNGKSAAGSTRAGRRGTLGRITRAILAVVALGVAISVLWVALYRVVPPPVTALMVGQWIGGSGISRSWQPIEEISPHLVRAVIAAEDSRFCQHRGFDWVELGNAWDAYRAGGRLRGASTITMQTAKNAFLWSGRSWTRKVFEAYYTPIIETIWPKRRIMEIYLNVAEFAPGVYGAEAAARHHFNTTASDLSQRQSALLASVLPAPRQWSASRPTAFIDRRAGTISSRMGVVQRDGLANCVL